MGTMGIRALLALNPGNIPRIGQDGMAIPLDWRILGFTLLASLVTGMLFGSVPALHAARPDLNTALKEDGSRSVAGRQNRTCSLMVIAEMAVAIVLLGPIVLCGDPALAISNAPACIMISQYATETNCHLKYHGGCSCGSAPRTGAGEKTIQLHAGGHSGGLRQRDVSYECGEGRHYAAAKVVAGGALRPE